MTNEEMRIAIAEACGWTEIQPSTAPEEFKRGSHGMLRLPGGVRTPSTQIPDYLNDLNAMHEAELVFIGEGKSPNYFAYRQQLYQLCCLSPELAIHATAAQRAEAFLRTKGLLPSCPDTEL